jgi:hypothetical protein
MEDTWIDYKKSKSQSRDSATHHEFDYVDGKWQRNSYDTVTMDDSESHNSVLTD